VGVGWGEKHKLNSGLTSGVLEKPITGRKENKPKISVNLIKL
jgi:hypothetical protein